MKRTIVLAVLVLANSLFAADTLFTARRNFLAPLS
jgi:hypothetical protein